MVSQTIKTEDFWNREHTVEKFWKGLEEGKILAKKCKECGAIDFPPHLACNVCGSIDTLEWVELSGKAQLKSFVFTGLLNARLDLEDRGEKYVCGEVEFEEGNSMNAIILNISKKKAREIQDKLPVPVKPVFYDWGKYTTLYFTLDE